MSELEESTLSNLERGLRLEWWAYICIASELPSESVSARAKELSERLDVGKDSIARRINAIQYAQNELHQADSEIFDAGQEATLSAYIKSRKAENASKTVTLGYRVSGDVKQLFDAEMVRIRDIANIPTPEQFFDWLVSHLSDLTAGEIRHSAGGRGAL